MITLRQLIRYSLIGLLSSLGPGAGAQTLGEALNATNLTWTTGGASPWTVDTNTAEDGFASLTSGNSILGQNNWVQTTVTGPTVVSFWWKLASTSCTLSFYIGSSVQTTLSGSADWGDNSGGQLNIPASASNVVAVSCGWYHSLALRADGRLVGWGGACGPGDCPRTVPTTATNIVSFACGGYSPDLAVRADGKLVQLIGLAPSWATNFAAVASGSSTAYGLVAAGPPKVTSPLANRSVVAGKTAYFYATAVGAWPLRYQWQLNGTNLPGATNVILAVTNALPAKAGVYSVLVSNAVGSASSQGATLTVLPTQAQIVATSITSSNGQFVLKATSPAGYVWMLQASVNLHNWSDVASATNASGAMTFTVAAADFDRCYFRLRLVQ